jgi:transposase
MYIREVNNRSGSVSIQVILKSRGKYKVLKSIGYGRSLQEIAALKEIARLEMSKLEKQLGLFVSKDDCFIKSFITTFSNDQVRIVGPELILGKIYDGIGFSDIPEELFRHLVITRLVNPGSKLKTIDYLLRYQGVRIKKDAVYRFLDKLHSIYKQEVEQIAFSHTLKVQNGHIGIVFYDMTTLHFEASDGDDLRQTGFSKVGRHQDPQIYLGLLVSATGFPIGYDIYEGGIYEGHTLIPFVKKFEKRFNLSKPVVVADSGLLNTDNIAYLESEGYTYILGARIKNESNLLKQQILSLNLNDGESIVINKETGRRLIVSFSTKRAKKDEYNRKRGLKRLEKNIKSGRLTKSNINKRGYNKYLRLEGEVKIEIDYDKFEQDAQWDGLKGYLTNTMLNAQQVIENYSCLWQIERAFRISKTDLLIRPIFHRLRHRIEAHICISFVAYTVYKELERILKLGKCTFSAKRAIELTKNMYQISYTLPETKLPQNLILKMDDEQQMLYSILNKFY